MKYINALLIILLIYSGHTFVETIVIEKQLANFKDTANVEVYELEDDIEFEFKMNDILLNRKSGHKNLIIRDIITFFTGGHSALVSSEDGLKTIEVFGYSDQLNYVSEYDNDWVQNEVEVIGLRTENADLNFTEYIGRKYDWYPYLPNKAKYCTELITDTYQNVGIHLDYDYGIATVNDIIISSKTDIFMYKEIRDGLVYLYWED